MKPEAARADGRIVIDPLLPFDLPLTVRVLQRRPTNRVDLWEDGAYRRVLLLQESHRLVSVRQVGGPDDARVLVRVEDGETSPGLMSAAALKVGRLLSVNAELAPFWAQVAADPALRPLGVAFRGLKPPRFPSLWDTLVNVVVFQQISLLAALAIVGRMVERFGATVVHHGRAHFTYPDPGAVAGSSIEELRALGLSRRKAEVLKALALDLGGGEALEEELRALPSPQAIDRLVQLPGIGRWSAEVILLRGLGRVDAFPGGDSGFNRGLADLLGRESGLSQSEERDLAERFGEYRGMLYLFVVAYRLTRLGLIDGTRLAR